MRMKLAAALAATSLMLAPAPAMASASSLSVASAAREGAAMNDESAYGGSGMMGFLLVFGAGAIVGALLYSVIKGGGDDEPASP